MTRTAVALRHVAFEDLGILGPLLESRGYAIRVAEPGIDPVLDPAVVDADLLVVLGGPIGVGDSDHYPFLDDEVRLLADRVGRDRPTLGICLGAQLLARALGAEVAPTGRVEIGYASLTLTTGSVLDLLGETPVLHWHGDQFEIPAGATRLAETPGFPNQAFAVGPHLLGLQFHLEADHTRIERWLVGHAHELAATGIDPGEIRADAQHYGPTLAARARAVFAAWLDQAGLP